MLFQYFALLDRFDSDDDELDLSYNRRTLRIRKIPKKTLEDFLLRRESSFPFVNDLFETAISLGERMYWIDYHYEVEDSREAMIRANNTVHEEMERVILALRLFKEGCVRIVFYVWRISETEKQFSSSVLGFRTGERLYFLANSELPALKDFHKDLRAFMCKRKESRTPLDRALSRFADGYERVKLEDKIMDYMIGLEALYLQGESSGELGYRFAHRMSVLLAAEKKERQQLFSQTTKSYKLRSRIVHGVKYKLSPQDVWFVEDKLRLSIKVFLRTPKPNWLNLIF